MNRFTSIMAVVLLLTTGTFAQERTGPPHKSEVPQDEKPNRLMNPPKQTDSGDTAESEDSILSAGSSISGELQKSLDVKKSEVGDEVVLKVTESIKQDGEVVIPKGTKLLGRVTEVQRKTKENPMSKLGVVFDRIEGKSLSAPFSASIVSIVESSNRLVASDLFGADSMGSARSSASSSGGGGGLLGGATGAVGNVVGSTAGVVGGVTGTAGNTLGGATQTLGTPLKGIQLSQGASGSANSATTLSSANKNLKVQQGATFNLRIDQSVGAN